MLFLELVGVILLIIAAIVVFVGIGYAFPKKMQETMEKNYGDPIVSTWWALAQAIFLAAFIFEIGNEEERAFWILLLVALAIFAVAVWICITKAKRVGAEKQDMVLACIAQICYALGIAVTIILILGLLFGRSKKKKR